MTTRLRCCGRFCFWQVPLGPWACSVCSRKFWSGPGVPGIPKAHRTRFDEAISEMVAKMDRQAVAR